MADPKELYLQPECCAGDETGRLWCQDPDPEECEDGVPWTRYVIADRIQQDLVDAIRIGLHGDTKSLEMLARRTCQRYKMRDLMQPLFDEFPAAIGSPLRDRS